MIDTKIIYYDLPCSVKGFIKETSDGYTYIVLNSRLNYEQNLSTLDHELYHIDNKDLEKNCNVTELEYQRHLLGK